MIKLSLKYKNKKYKSGFKINSQPKDRLKILSVFFILLALLIIVRLGYVQIWDHKFYENIASKNHDFYKNLFPVRGEIYIQDPYDDSGLHKIAVNQDLSVVYANPWQIEKREQTVKDLAPLLGMSQEELNQRLEPTTLDDGRKDTYEVLKRKISSYEKEAIEEFDIAGIYFTEEAWRYYPDKEYTSHLTGYLGMKDEQKTGLYGLESYYNDELGGVAGYIQTEKDAGGRLISIGDRTMEAAKDGDNLYLTVDKNVQFFACQALKEAVDQYAAKQGTVIIMDPHTGAITALCGYPSYDPNKYNEVENINVFIDQAVSDQYEPGSVFKSFSLGAALDMGKITPYTTYNDTGEVKIGKYTIQNSDDKSNGTVDMNYVLTHSLNTGSIFAVEQIGNEAWYQYVKNFGFGELTGITLAGENYGNITALEKLADIYSATSSYGQGITVTPIQLITAFSSIANGGKLMKPYVVQEVEKPSGEKIITQPEVVRQVISAQTASTLSAMLVNVIDSGHAVLAQVPGYYMAGKTGTAQVPKENGAGYDAYRHKDSFLGFGPVSNPKFVILTKLDEPANAPWAANTTAPLFSKIATYLVDYYQLMPDKE
ncbi:MAG: penicillin-binding protein 2 [Patescibacteria group bacterium]